MFIKLVCPNGHKLRVKEIHAGQRAVCPKCEARLVIPQPKAKQISDSSVLAVLGDYNSSRSVVARPAAITAPQQPSPLPGARTLPQQRKCVKCQALMSAKVRICPKCQLYQPAAAVPRPQAQDCPACGERCVPGASACTSCGAMLHAA